MKHNWAVTPRGKKTKYYTCQVCSMQIVATSKKEADSAAALLDGQIPKRTP